jgi:hypothetical protein
MVAVLMRRRLDMLAGGGCMVEDLAIDSTACGRMLRPTRKPQFRIFRFNAKVFNRSWNNHGAHSPGHAKVHQSDQA